MKNWYSEAVDQTLQFKNFRMTVIRKKCMFFLEKKKQSALKIFFGVAMEKGCGSGQKVELYSFSKAQKNS